jgi:protein ImuB
MLACVLLPPTGTLPPGELLCRLFTVSPLVELDGEVALLEDAGLQRLHGGPAGLFAAIRRALHPHAPRGLALASNRWTAEVAARYMGRPVTVHVGEEALFLSRLPLTALPLEKNLARRLLPLGLETLGDLASLPVAAVERRYGREGVALHRLARGVDGRGLLPAREPAQRALARALDEPAARLEQLRPALEELVARLCGALAQEGQGVLVLRLGALLDAALPDDDVAAQEEPQTAPRTAGWELSLPAPEERAPLLVELLVQRIEAAPPARAVAALRLSAPQVGRLAVHQNALFGELQRDEARRQEALARLAAVLGSAALPRPRLLRDHRLEARWTASDEQVAPERAGAPRAGGPVLRVLRPPEEVVPLLAGGTLVGLRRGRRELLVARLCGPRRLCGGWWAQPWERDEYEVVTGDGAQLRLGHDARAHRWLLLAEAD